MTMITNKHSCSTARYAQHLSIRQNSARIVRYNSDHYRLNLINSLYYCVSEGINTHACTYLTNA